MHPPQNPTDSWVQELAGFLRRHPGVNAVRIDPAAHQVAVATLGRVDLGDFEEKLAETIAAFEAQLAAKTPAAAPVGYTVRRQGGAVVLGRDTCETAEKLWLWREMEWPAITAEPLARGAGVAAARLAGGRLRHQPAPWASPASISCAGPEWLSKGVCTAVALIAGGWDAAIDTWDNLRKREIDIHFLMLAVAVGAVSIGAWGEAVLLLFLFSASGAMEEYSLDRTQREVGALLKSAPKRATLVLARRQRGGGGRRDPPGRPAGAGAPGRGVCRPTAR